MGNVGRPPGRFTQHRRLERLRELLTRSPKGVSLYDLADHLQVTPRSMRRYLREVKKELQLESVPTRSGGALLWRVRPSELPRKLELRRTQVYALLAARKLFEPFKGSAFYDEVDFAVNRLLDMAHRPGRGPNALPADTRLEDRFLYLPFTPKVYSERTDELDDLLQAVADLRPLSCLYRSAGRSEEERITVHPYAIVLHKDSVYCVGFHTGHQEIRTLLLDRMRDTEASVGERFTLPASFKVEDYFQGEFGIWRSKDRHKVVVDFDAKGAEYVRQRKVHASQKLSSLPGGGVRLTMTVGSLHELVPWVLGWGPRATVREPAELVERVKGELGEALAGYGGKPQRRAR